MPSRYAFQVNSHPLACGHVHRQQALVGAARDEQVPAQHKAHGAARAAVRLHAAPLRHRLLGVGVQQQLAVDQPRDDELLGRVEVDILGATNGSSNVGAASVRHRSVSANFLWLCRQIFSGPGSLQQEKWC